MTDHYLKRITYAKNTRAELDKLFVAILKDAPIVVVKDKIYLSTLFDLVIQSALICAGLTDGQITENELSFIKELSDRRALAYYFDRYSASVNSGLPPLDLDELPEIAEALDQNGRKNLSAFVVQSVMNEARLVARAGATAQKSTGKNYLYALESGFLNIVYAFCEIDGDNIQDIKAGNVKLANEVGVCDAVFKLLIKENWKS